MSAGGSLGSEEAAGCEGVDLKEVAGEAKRVDRSACLRRGSDLGRNLNGVWYTEGSAAGGLKMIVSDPVVEGAKSGWGAMFNARFVRENV